MASVSFLLRKERCHLLNAELPVSDVSIQKKKVGFFL